MFKVAELLAATGGKLISGNRDTPVKGISIDSRTIKPQEAFLAIRGERFDGHDFINQAAKNGCKVIIAEARKVADKIHIGKSIFIEVKDTTGALGDIAWYHRKKFDIPVIVITGSNGKTTTKEMVAWVLSCDFKVLKNAGTENNHIGLPLTLLSMNRSVDIAVLEAGTNHPGEIDYLAQIASPTMAVITNIGPSHLQYFGDLNGVLREKTSLIKHLENPHIAVLNADDKLLNKLLKKKSAKPVAFGFGIKEKTEFCASSIKNSGRLTEFLVNRKHRFTLKVPGRYNVSNALAAITVARIFGVKYRDIIDKLSGFSLPKNRMNFLELNNTKFINDTYNSNPLSLKQALDVLQEFPTAGRKIVIMGDMLELGSREELFHRQAGERIARACDIFITVGRLSRLAADKASESGLNMKNIFACESNLEARDILFTRISPGPDDIVLVKGSRSMKMEEIFNL